MAAAVPGLRVVIAEDAALFREGLAQLIESRGHQVACSVADGAALVAAVARDRPDVVVADVRMPPTHTDEGLRAAIELRRVHPRLGVLVLRVNDDGHGGADPAAGSGLAGLAQRARTVDGRLEVTSPPGGPTQVTVELPLHA